MSRNVMVSRYQAGICGMASKLHLRVHGLQECCYGMIQAPSTRTVRGTFTIGRWCVGSDVEEGRVSSSP